MAEKNIHSGHRERIRNRFEETGLSAFSEHEILEMILFYSIPRRNTNEYGHQLIDKFKTLNRVLEADIEELKEVKGISETSAILINLIGNLCRSYLSSAHLSVKLNTIEKVKNYYLDAFGNNTNDIYKFVFIDADGNVISGYTFSGEQLNDENFTPKLFTSMIIRKSVSGFFIGHNLFNEILIPSEFDYYLMKKSAECMKSFDISLMDYIMCNGKTASSLREKGAFSFEWK